MYNLDCPLFSPSSSLLSKMPSHFCLIGANFVFMPTSGHSNKNAQSISFYWMSVNKRDILELAIHNDNSLRVCMRMGNSKPVFPLGRYGPLRPGTLLPSRQ